MFIMGTVQWLIDVKHFCAVEPSVTEKISFLESNLVRFIQEGMG